MSRRTYTLLLLLLMLLALLPRLWLWNEQGRAGVVYPGDQDEYYRGAVHILLQGEYYDDGQWLRPPLTSIFLAGVFALFGVDVARALLVQAVLSVLTLPLLAELARSMFNSRRAGLLAALLAGLFLPYASYASQLLSETLFIFFIAAGLLLFEAARQRGMPWHWLAMGGMVWALAALTRPVGLYAVPLLLLWALWHSLAARRSWRALLPPAALLAGFLLVLLPWTARNYAVHGHLILVDTNGGTSFWLGNLLEPDERELQFVWNRTIPNLAEREDAALQRAFENIRREPLTFLARTRSKAVALWQFDIRLFIANAPIGITLEESSLAFATASDAQYIVIMLLAVVGVVLARRSEHSLPLLLWPLYGTLLSAVSLGHPRLRLPLLVAAFVYAALPLAHPRLVWQRLRAAAWWRKLLLLAALLALLLLWFARVYMPFAQSQFWLLRARLADNPALLERASAAMPESYLPYAALGAMQREQGDLPGALAAYEAAHARAPQNARINAHLLSLYRRFGHVAEMRQAMAALAAFGWDNNQTYAWAWRNLPPAPVPRLDTSAPALGVLRGVYPQETDGTYTFRWTHERAAMRLALPGAQTLLLLLRAPQPATPVAVFCNGEHVAVLQVGTAWQTFSVPLPASTSTQGQGWQHIELQAPTHVHSTAEPYPRGVALGGAWLER